MLKNYLKIAFRNLRKDKAYSIINVIGLSVGLAAGILIILWVMDELSFNKFDKNINDIYLVAQTQHYKNMGDFTVAPTPTALAPYLKSEYHEIKYAARYTSFGEKKLVNYKSKNFSETIKYADPEFLKIFTFKFLEGNAQNVLNQPNSIVLTNEAAKKFFGSQEAIGKTLNVDGNLVKNLTLQFLKWVILANIIAWPIAYYYLNNWLKIFPYRIELNIWFFIGAGLIALFIASITVSFQAIRAATANPIKAIKYE